MLNKVNCIYIQRNSYKYIYTPTKSTEQEIDKHSTIIDTGRNDCQVSIILDWMLGCNS